MLFPRQLRELLQQQLLQLLLPILERLHLRYSPHWLHRVLFCARLSERKKERDEANAASSEGEVVPESAEATEEVVAEAAPEAVEETAPAVEETETAEAEEKPAEEVVETTAEDLSGKTVADLKALAKKTGISGYSKMKKAELIAALSA